MPDMIRGIRACVFDAYGTLFDIRSATRESLYALGPAAETLNHLWRQKQLEYTWLRAAQGRHADFWQVTREALDFALASLGIDRGEQREKLMDAYLRLNAFPDAVEALELLRGRGLRLAILSNGSPAMLRSAVEHAGLSGAFEAVLSVETAGVFKPHPRVYQLAADRLALAPGEIAFVSANGWDAHAAAAFGLRAIWCNRSGQPDEHLPGQPEIVLKSLYELADRVGAG